MNISFENKEGLEFLRTVDKNSIDLVLTDPPYIISKETGMNRLRDSILALEKSGDNQIKTEIEWEQYKISKGILTNEKKELYQKYGSIYGKK